MSTSHGRLSPAPTTYPVGPPPARPRSLTFLNVVSLCVSLQIGAGLFAAPSQVTQFSPNPGTSVLLWAAGGVLVWTGAATFVELGLRIPENGGVQEYLRAGFGEGMGFVFTLTWVVLTKPASMGIVSVVFAEYLLRSFVPGLGRRGDGDGEHGRPRSAGDEWIVKGVGFVGLAGLTVVNCLGAVTGAKVSNGFFVMKTLALVSVIMLGFGSLLAGKAHGVPEDENGWFGGQEEGLDLWTRVGRIVTALFGVLYVYGGWESIGFYLGDVKRPTVTLPRAMNTAMVLCIVGFTSMAAALYIALPLKVIRDNNAVAIELGNQMLGAFGSIIYSLVVSVSALGSMNSNIFATGRLCARAGERRYLPGILANRHFESGTDELDYYRESRIPSPFRKFVIWFAAKTQTLRLEKQVPIYAMLLNLAISTVYLCLGTLNGLITFVGLSEYFFWFLCTAGLLFRLRPRDREKVESYQAILAPPNESNDVGPESSLEEEYEEESASCGKPYRTWTGYPVIFLLFSGMVLTRGALSDPLQGLGIIGTMTAGWVVWLIKQRGQEEVKGRRGSTDEEEEPLLSRD